MGNAILSFSFARVTEVRHIHVTRNLACGNLQIQQVEVAYLPKLSRFCHYFVEQPPGIH